MILNLILLITIVITAIIKAYYQTKIDMEHQKLIDLLERQGINTKQSVISINLKGTTKQFYFQWPLDIAIRDRIWTVEISDEIQDS